jgi:hypothetical protein
MSANAASPLPPVHTILLLSQPNDGGAGAGCLPAYRLWSMLLAEMWSKMYLDAPGSQPSPVVSG